MVTSCDTGPEAWRHQEEIVREHFPRSDPSLVLMEDPDRADLILVGNPRPENDWENLRACAIVRRFPNKAFVLNDSDDLFPFCRGIQTSLTRSAWNLSRFRSGSYFLFHPDFKNSFIERRFASRASSASPAPTKQYLASFSGRNCLPLRQRLLNLSWKRADVFVRDTTNSFDNFTHQSVGKGPAQEAYCDVALRSKFLLCPRGNGAASIRFFEAMQLGVAPVLISDDWVLPEGPDWTQCMLQIREKELDRLEELLVRYENRAEAMGAAAQKAYETFFHGEAYIRYLISAARSIQRQPTVIPERWLQRMWAPSLYAKKIQRRLRRFGSSRSLRRARG